MCLVEVHHKVLSFLKDFSIHITEIKLAVFVSTVLAQYDFFLCSWLHLVVTHAKIECVYDVA